MYKASAILTKEIASATVHIHQTQQLSSVWVHFILLGLQCVPQKTLGFAQNLICHTVGNAIICPYSRFKNALGLLNENLGAKKL